MSAPLRRGKGKIKPPRKQIGIDSNTQETWKSLSKAIREIQNHNAAKLSFEENYRYAYNMVLYKQGPVLYEGVCKLIIENLDGLARDTIVPAFPVLGEREAIQEAQEGERLLKAFRSVWDDHTSNMAKLRDLLKYMDRVYTEAASVPMIWDAGLELFLERIIRSPVYPIREYLLKAILRQIRLERDGYPVNRLAIKECVDIYRQLRDSKANSSVFAVELESDIISESRAYYTSEGESLLETCDAPEFLRRVSDRITSEQTRASTYLPSTVAALSAILREHLLIPHLSSVVNMPSSGLDTMIDLNQNDDLGRMYTLFALVNPQGHIILKKAVKESIIRRGSVVNATDGAADGDGDAEGEGEGDDAGPSKEKEKGKGKGKERAAAGGPARKKLDLALKWVQDVLDLKDVFDKVLKGPFGDDKAMQTAMNEAFESFINLNPKAPEYISLFIDENLKKGLKGKTDDEVDIVLDKTITVFRFVTEKDVFETYYKAHLAKRLLTGRSVSDDAERGMLAKLKIECGFQFTQKLEGMFHDMKISADTMTAYKEFLGRSTTEPPPIEISAQVLTSTFWPMSHTASPCSFPPEMSQTCSAFERFYLSRHSGRRLSWQPSMGHADVRVLVKSGKRYELNVSTYALVILLLFENLGGEEFLTYEDLRNATSIPDADLKRNLQSLACAKYKILKKHPPGRDVNEDDSFSFNDDFTSSLQRIKISTVSTKVESSGERKETRDKVDEERKFQMEACIVRVMKNSKRMGHNELINEVTRLLSSRFTPNPSAIKKRIEALLDREYLDRGEDKKSYIYLA